MRFTLCWNTAVIFPMINVSAVIIATSSCHISWIAPKALLNNLMKAINAAAFTIVAIKDVKTVGAPSYTSGVQKWNGAADTLNDIENMSNTTPAIIITEGLFPGNTILFVKKLPVSPYTRVIPISISPVEKAPSKKYFNEASLLLRFLLSLPVKTYNGIEIISIPRKSISREVKDEARMIPHKIKKMSAK